MISRYMVLVAGEQKLLMMRPYQIYAVKAIVECIHQNCGNGYIWHTTGSGKTLKKCKMSDDVLFINASEHFEKGKRQNRLLPEHIQKILDTYQYRTEEDRYSLRVSMEKIAAEDYNLNISRYITTAVDDVEIDLAAVNDNLIVLEQKINQSTQKHNDFLKELGLPPLP